jgi:hypothetical protein
MAELAPTDLTTAITNFLSPHDKHATRGSSH